MVSRMNLRELTEDQKKILSLVEDGELTFDEVADHIEFIESERTVKIENYLHVINRLESELSTVSGEIDRLETIRKTKSNSISRLKDWLSECVGEDEKFEFDLFKVSKRKGRKIVEVINQNDIPSSFVDVRQSIHIDKKKIMEKLKLGEDIPGVKMATGKSSLIIK